MNEIDLWDTAGYVVSGTYRGKVLKSLSDGVKTPTRVSNDEDIDMPHTSRALQELREQGLVDLKVSEDTKKGRIYGITEKGEKIHEHISEHMEYKHE